jgi:hypothetical protein
LIFIKNTSATTPLSDWKGEFPKPHKIYGASIAIIVNTKIQALPSLSFVRETHTAPNGVNIIQTL